MDRPDSVEKMSTENPFIKTLSLLKRLWWFSTQKAPEVVPARSASDKPVVHIDVTRISQGDLRTGIQRVVRQISRHWYQRPDRGVRINFTRVNDKGEVVDAWEWAKNTIPSFSPEIEPERPMIREGDVYFCLDLVMPPKGLSRRSVTSLQQAGVRVVFLVYDVLSVTHPQFFRLSSRFFFRWWLQAVQHCDAIITISEDAKRSIQNYLDARPRSTKDIPISVIPLSGEPEHSGELDNSSTRYELTKPDGTLFIAVGTIEPRKGYGDLLDGFDELWSQGDESSLWIFGRPGWKTKRLQKRILTHPQYGEHLEWFSDATDQDIQNAMGLADALIINSYAEGLGLPILEAQANGLPVVARDIAVFREVGPSHVIFIPEVQDPFGVAAELHKLAVGVERGRTGSDEAQTATNWLVACRATEQAILLELARRSTL